MRAALRVCEAVPDIGGPGIGKGTDARRFSRAYYALRRDDTESPAL
jgi:hypothetical protein